MKKVSLIISKVAVFLLFVAFSQSAFSQSNSNRWEPSILKFEEGDKLNPPSQKDLIVFAGSSSIVIWNDIKSYFPEKNIINRGFGGSQTSDLILYMDRVITKYNPKQVFIYEGENDIADSNKSPETVLADFETIFNHLRKNNKKVNIVFISIKPSPIRTQFAEKYIKANALIKGFINQQKNASFIDIYTKMLDKDGNIRPELYLDDRLHMAPAGYKIWTEAVRSYLK